MWEKILIEGVLHRRSHSIPLMINLLGFVTVSSLAVQRLPLFLHHCLVYNNYAVILYHVLLVYAYVGVNKKKEEDFQKQFCVRKLMQIFGIASSARAVHHDM